MRKSLIFAIFTIVATAFSVSAQVVYTPDVGSDERKVILDVLRIPVERDLKQPIVFVIESFKVKGTWAFITGEPTKPDGGRPDLSKTAWKGSEDLFDDNFFGLLRKTNGKWRVIKQALGCTDVCYADWWQKYKAPKAIFPYTEQ